MMHMKNTKAMHFLRLGILAICLGFIPLSGMGQLFVGIGGQAGFMNLKNANAAVDYFNSKGFLVRQLRQFHWPFGLIYSASYRDNGLLLELSLNTKRARVSAESANGSAIQRRDHRFTISSLSPAVGFAAVDNENAQVYLVGSLDIGYMRYLSRVGDKTNINRINYVLYRRQGFLGTTLSMRFTFRDGEDDPTVWTFAPYIQIPFSEFDFREFNVVLNPLDHQEVGTSLPARPINFGAVLSFDLDLLDLIER